MRWLLVLLAAAGSTIAPAYAEQGAEPIDWLARMVAAAQHLSYTGTFVYQSGGQTETSRITHVVDASGEHEKLEVLDGSPREVVRNNDEVRCFLPAEHMVIIDRQGSHKAFPARLPASLDSLAEYYRIRKGEVGRVAGFDSQLLILEPKDNLRFGHMLWADKDTGLLLKARMVNEKNEPIEQFYFTKVQIGGNIDRDVLRPKYSGSTGQWRVENSKTMDSNVDDGGWVFRSQVPGFKKIASMKRQLRDNMPQMMHYVFTDGLAAISVFIEPLAGKKEIPRAGMYSTGAINVYKRILGDHAIVVVGEVPSRTLMALGDGIEPGKN
jgi:sigma-E factor negative regulatory protein RseB